jgi:hypothetical protein
MIFYLGRSSAFTNENVLFDRVWTELVLTQTSNPSAIQRNCYVFFTCSGHFSFSYAV